MGNGVRNLACEGAGTFALTLLGGGAILATVWTDGSPGLVGIAFAHGLALAVAVTATMNVSGGHINPAVTIALWTTRRISSRSAAGYIVAQCAGATIAGLLLAVVFRAVGPSTAGVTGPAAIVGSALGTPRYFPEQIPVGMVLLVEAALTFLLMFSIMGTAVDPRAPRIGGFGIGLTLTGAILMGGPLTGAALNPARTIGTLIGGGAATAPLWSQHWVYWAGPTVGAVLAAWFYDAFIMQRGETRPAPS